MLREEVQHKMFSRTSLHKLPIKIDCSTLSKDVKIRAAIHNLLERCTAAEQTCLLVIWSTVRRPSRKSRGEREASVNINGDVVSNVLCSRTTDTSNSLNLYIDVHAVCLQGHFRPIARKQEDLAKSFCNRNLNNLSVQTRSIWKMLDRFITASRLTPIQQMSLAVLSRAACASMSTTTTRDRGDRYGPMEWAQKLCKLVQVFYRYGPANIVAPFFLAHPVSKCFSRSSSLVVVKPVYPR